MVTGIALKAKAIVVCGVGPSGRYLVGHLLKEGAEVAHCGYQWR